MSYALVSLVGMRKENERRFFVRWDKKVVDKAFFDHFDFFSTWEMFFLKQ